MLASFGWILQAFVACLIASGADATPIVLVVTGSGLLALTLFADGDLPLAAVGVAAIGAVAASIATLTVVGQLASSEHALWLAPAATLALGFVAAPWLVAHAGAASRVHATRTQASSARIRAVVAFECVVIAVVGVATFPALAREPSLAEARAAEPVASEAEPEVTFVPRGALSAAHHVDRSADLGEVVARPTRAVRSSRRNAVPLGFAGVWLVGLALALGGTFALHRALRRLSRLEGAVLARRRPTAFVLEDGEAVWLDREPRGDEALVVLDPRAPGYRGDARVRGTIVGMGTMEEQREALKRRIATAALGTVLTTATAWMPLLIFRLAGWALAPIF